MWQKLVVGEKKAEETKEKSQRLGHKAHSEKKMKKSNKENNIAHKNKRIKPEETSYLRRNLKWGKKAKYT